MAGSDWTVWVVSMSKSNFHLPSGNLVLSICQKTPVCSKNPAAMYNVIGMLVAAFVSSVSDECLPCLVSQFHSVILMLVDMKSMSKKEAEG